MDAVCDMRNGHLIDRLCGPEFLPKRARDLAVFTADAVGGAAHSDRQRSQAVWLAWVVRVDTTQRYKIFMR